MGNKYEASIYDSLMYSGPEPRVPINKLNIRDWSNLEQKEAEIVALRMEQGLPPEALKLSYDGFKAIHAHLFQDIYEWAGKERTYTTGRNQNAPFAPPEHIGSWMQQQFETLRHDNYLKGTDPDLFATKSAGLVNEINAAHPFIEGNGRTQRVWLRLVAENTGFSLDIRKEDREAWNEASRIGFLSSNEPMAQLIHSRLSITPQHTQLPSEPIAQPNSQAAENSLIEHVQNYKQRKALEREMAQPKSDQPAPAENQQPSAPNSENKPPRSSPGPSF